MIRQTVGFLLLALSAETFASCNVDQVSIERRSGFSLDIFSSDFTERETINIPLRIDGKPACYKQTSNIRIQTERIKENEFVEYEITPLSADFENVPDAQIFQYVFIDFEDSIKASKIHIASFLCSGESPIGGDAFSDSLVKLSENSKSPEASTSIFIATGTAAEEIAVSQARKARSKVFDRFLRLFEYRTGMTSIDTDNSNIYVPNVVAGLSIEASSSLHRKLYSAFFTRTNSSVNGCSAKFRKNMHDLLIENVAKNNPFSGIEIWKKRFSSKYKLKWTL